MWNRCPPITWHVNPEPVELIPPESNTDHDKGRCAIMEFNPRNRTIWLSSPNSRMALELASLGIESVVESIVTK